MKDKCLLSWLLFSGSPGPFGGWGWGWERNKCLRVQEGEQAFPPSPAGGQTEFPGFPTECPTPTLSLCSRRLTGCPEVLGKWVLPKALPCTVAGQTLFQGTAQAWGMRLAVVTLKNLSWSLLPCHLWCVSPLGSHGAHRAGKATK